MRKEHKNPAGGLSAKGRRELPGNLRPPVKGRPKSKEDLRRKGQYLARAAGQKGPMYDSKGRPTRLKLALRAWGATDRTDARAKSKRLLDRYSKLKAQSKTSK